MSNQNKIPKIPKIIIPILSNPAKEYWKKTPFMFDEKELQSLAKFNL